MGEVWQDAKTSWVGVLRKRLKKKQKTKKQPRPQLAGNRYKSCCNRGWRHPGTAYCLSGVDKAAELSPSPGSEDGPSGHTVCTFIFMWGLLERTQLIWDSCGQAHDPVTPLTVEQEDTMQRRHCSLQQKHPQRPSVRPYTGRGRNRK